MAPRAVQGLYKPGPGLAQACTAVAGISLLLPSNSSMHCSSPAQGCTSLAQAGLRLG